MSPIRVGDFRFWERLLARLQLQESFPSGPPPAISKLIQPVMEVGPTLLRPKNATVTVTGLGASQTALLFTVPAGYRWHVKSWNIEVTAGDGTISKAFLTEPLTVISHAIDQWTASVVRTINMSGMGIVLDGGWRCRVGFNFVSTSSTIESTLHVQEERMADYYVT